MRRLPFAKTLAAKRLAGEDPWLVLLSVGAEGIRVPRRALPLERAGTAYVRLPDELSVAAVDWRVMVALDVLLVLEPECTRERFQEVCAALWGARIATLHFVWHHPRTGRAHAAEVLRNPYYRGLRHQLEFETYHSGAAPIDEAFREYIRLRRENAMLLGEAPLFSGSDFRAAREAQLRELYGDLYTTELI